MNSLKELKALVNKAYMEALAKDLEEIDMDPAEKDIIFAEECRKAGIDLRKVVLGGLE